MIIKICNIQTNKWHIYMYMNYEYDEKQTNKNDFF